MAEIRTQTGTRGSTQGQFTKPSVLYPTPDATNDFLIVERKTVDSKEQPIAYGTAHPLVSTATLVDQKFELEEDGKKTRVRIYSGNGTYTQQDAYNSSFKWADASNAHPIVIRTYETKRSTYTAGTTGTADAVVTGAKLVAEEATPHPDRKGRIIVTKVFETIPGPALTGQVVTADGQVGTLTRQSVEPGTTVTPSALLVSGSVQPESAAKSIKETITVPDVFPETQKSKSQLTKIPERFFSEEVTQESSVAAATDVEPTVGTGGVGVIEQSKQRVTAFRVKTSTTTAPSSTVAAVGAVLDNWGLVQTETETIVAAGTSPDTGHNVENSDVKPIGGGKAIKSVVNRASAPTKESKKAGNLGDTPAQFRKTATITQARTETSTSPAVSSVVVGADGIVESEVDQIRSDRWEKTDTTLSGIDTEVTGKKMDSWGIVQTETETIVAAGTSPTTTWHTEVASVEEIGGNKAVQKIVARTAAPTRSKKRAGTTDVIPAVFRANKPTTITVTETENDPGTSTPTFTSGGVHQSEVDQVRVDRFEKTDVKQEYATEVSGQDFDEELGVPIPFTWQITTAYPTNFDGEIIPLAENLFRTEQNSFTGTSDVKEFVTLENIKLPDTITDVGVLWARDEGSSADATQPVTTTTVSFGSVAVNTKYNISKSKTAAVTGTPYFDISPGYTGVVEAKLHVYIASALELNINSIKSRVNAAGLLPKTPVFADRKIVVTNRSARVSLNGTVSYGSATGGYTYDGLTYPGGGVDKNVSVTILKLPNDALISDQLDVLGAESDERKIDISVAYGASAQSVQTEATVSPTSIAATPAYSRGVYITRIDINPFRNGYHRVAVVTVDTTSL